MTRTKYIWFYLTVFSFFCSCSKESKSQEFMDTVITATCADDDTRTAVQNGGTEVFWEPGDEITVFSYGSGYQFISSCTVNSKTSKFTGSFKIEDFEKNPSSLIGLYPFSNSARISSGNITTQLPSKQIARAGTFAKGANISLGKMNGSEMSFYNVCGGIRFSLTRDGVRKVILQGNNSENLAGTLTAKFEDERPSVKSVSDGKTTITLCAPGRDTFEKGKWYYFVLLPGTLTNGFTMTFITSNKYATAKSSKTTTIKRGAFISINEIDKNIDYKDIYNFVDMGLSVKWADCNIGALKPEEGGDRYAWGEIETKDSYLVSNYKYGIVENYTLYVTKYCRADFPKYWYNYSSGVNEPDNILILEESDDVANADLGGGFHIPNSDEWTELITHCTWTLTTQNGVIGKRVTSNLTGYEDKSIFLPIKGRSDSPNCDEGYYWTSSISRRNDCCNCGTNVRFAGDYVTFDYVYLRSFGFNIRPVSK